MKKLFCLFIVLINIFANVNSYAVPDYKSKLNTILDEPRIFFEPEKVESMLQKSFADPLAFDLDAAVKAYDELTKENGGYMSVDDLFYVCLVATHEENVKKERKDWKSYTWDYCKYTFILPLIKLSEEEIFIDENVVEVYDGTIFYKGCTEPAVATEEEDVLNMVCTTGKYKDIDPAFEKAMITTFRLEGGCANVRDGNGMTCYGIGSASHPEVLNKNFSRADAERIAYNDYYKNLNIDTLPDAIRGDVFREYFRSGKYKNTIWVLQDILGVERSSVITPETVEAARNYKGNLRKRFLKARWEKNKDNKRFSNGWAKGFLALLKNGCHTETETPLLRTQETIDECKKHL